MSELQDNSLGVSPMRKPRNNAAPAEKVAILRRHLIDPPVSDICDEYDPQPTPFYFRRKQFFENGAADLRRARPQARGGP